MAWTRYAAGSPLADYFRDGSAEIVMAASRGGADVFRLGAPQIAKDMV